MCCERLAENTGRKKSPFWHHCTTLSGCIFAAEACIDNRKKLLNTDTFSTCPCNMVDFGLLMAGNFWRVWDNPADFNRFRILAALLHGTPVVGVSQTAALNRGHHLYLARRPSRLALAHILVGHVLTFSCQMAYYRCLYRPELPVLHLLWGVMEWFFRLKLPKPELIWMKSGI